MRISVVVPVRDDPHVDGLLASLDAQCGAPEFEVLVAMDCLSLIDHPPSLYIGGWVPGNITDQGYMYGKS